MTSWKTICRVLAVSTVTIILASCGGGGSSSSNPPAASPTTFTISATTSPAAGGTVSGTGSFVIGQNVTLTATTNTGYTFINWTENSATVSSNPSYGFSASANRVLVANFQINNYSMAVSVNPSAGGTVTGGGSYAHGDNVILLATSNAGYAFVNWTESSTEVATSASYSFTASADRTLVANFQATSSGGINPNLTLLQSKVFRFTWTDVPGNTHYRLLENPDGISGFTQVGSDIAQGVQIYDHIVPLHARLNAQYILQSCNGADCADSSALAVSNSLVPAIGYLKASNTGEYDYFGAALSLSADGNTLAVGAYREASDATGINGTQTNNLANYSGAVYVFTRNGGLWVQQAYLKASNSDAGDRFGYSLSLSADGNTLAVGSWSEGSNASGINGNQADNSAGDSGAAYIFTRSGNTWTQQAYLKASNNDANNYFGVALSLSADGNTLAVGAYGESSNAIGVGGNQADNTAPSSGAVYVFTRNAGIWSQQAYLKASNTEAIDFFGLSLSLSGDGNTLAVGAVREDSNATSIGGNQADNSALESGAVYVFTRSSNTWNQQAYLKASNTEANDWFGAVLELSGDGSTLAVGAHFEDSNASGIDGNQTDNSANGSGAVYVFTRSGNIWNQQTYIKASNASAGDAFGISLSLSTDGNTLAVGANREDGNAKGIGGDQADNSAGGSGAVYTFTRSTGIWNQQAYIKANNTDALDEYGTALSLNADGSTLATGTYLEDSNATGVSGNQANNRMRDSGAVYLY